MIEMTLSHETALDLAADKIDFGLSAAEEASLVAHLEGCFDCKRFAEMMASDKTLLDTSITWEDAAPGGESGMWDDLFDDDYERRPEDPSRPRSDDEDDESDDDAADREDAHSVDLPDPRGDDEDEDDDDAEDDSAYSEFDEGYSEDGKTLKKAPADDDEEIDVTPVAADMAELEDDDDEPSVDEEKPARISTESEDEAEDDEPTLDDGTTGTEPPTGEDADIHTTHDTEEQDEAYAIKAEVEALTDEELGGVDEDGENVAPDCAADGVEAAAEANGAPVGDHVHQRAERAVQDEDGVARTAYGRVAVYKSTKGIRTSRGGYGYVEPIASATAARAIRNAVLRSRTGRTGVERFMKRGRLDGKSLHRIAWKDERIFKKNTSADPGKYFIRVAVDVSGSMSGQPVADAAAVARALAEATVGTPSVRLEIWAWSDPFTANHKPYYGRSPGKNIGISCSAGVVKIWGRGMPTTEVFRLAQLPMGGTPDAPVLDWMWRDLLKEAGSDETPVVIMCSDGWGDSSLPKVIEAATKHGVRVMNVALGNYVHEEDQLARFGRDNYVPWMGSMERTARPLADMILRLVTGEG